MQKYLFSTLIFLLPLFVSSMTINIFTTPKLILLVLVVLSLTLSWLANLITTKSLATSSSPLRLGIMAFAVAIILNLIAYSSGRLESLVGPGIVYLLMCAWAYFLSMSTSKLTHTLVIRASILASSILALHSLLQITFLYRLSTLPLFMQTRAFTPTGSVLTTFILLVIGGVLSLYLSFNQPKSRVLFTASAMLHVIALISLGFLIFPGQELAPLILPLPASWNIALDSMKSIKTFFLGVGLSNFPIFYKSVKPLFLNSTPFWNNTPLSSGSELLQIMTTTGIVGLLTFLTLPLIAFKQSLTVRGDLSVVIMTIISAIALAFTPSSLPLLLIFFTGIGLLSATDHNTRALTPKILIITCVTTIAITSYLGYQSYQVIAAEVNMHRAQVALTKNDGKTVYEQNLAAINKLPAMTSYHLSFSQVNLSLAGALSQKETLTDAERSNVTQLVSQSISEAKTATSLRPQDSTTWQNLGSLYRNMINVATGSDQFAIAAYTQAIALDPANPTLRVEYGGLLYQLAQNNQKPEDQITLLSRAQNEFQTAISLKPDYANAYYNLSKLLESAKDYNNSYLAMQKAISLLGPDNADLGRASAELETLKSKIPKASSSPSPSPTPTTSNKSDLAEPSPLPSPLSGGPLTLPVIN